MSKTIEFYEAKERPYGVFCNYYISPIQIDSKTYASVEHYYQSQKFHGIDEEYEEIVRTAATPHQSKVLAALRIGGVYKWRTDLNIIIQKHKEKGVQIRKEWEEVKDSVMLVGLQAKFTQHIHLCDILLNTKNDTIVENSPIDWYWGCGKDKKGQNKLGQLLMQVRLELKNSTNMNKPGSLKSFFTHSTNNNNKRKNDFVDESNDSKFKKIDNSMNKDDQIDLSMKKD